MRGTRKSNMATPEPCSAGRGASGAEWHCRLPSLSLGLGLCNFLKDYHRRLMAQIDGDNQRYRNQPKSKFPSWASPLQKKMVVKGDLDPAVIRLCGIVFVRLCCFFSNMYLSYRRFNFESDSTMCFAAEACSYHGTCSQF